MTRTALFAALLAPAVALAAPPPEADTFRSPPLAESLAAGHPLLASAAAVIAALAEWLAAHEKHG